jgi:hypothetical protein
VVIPWAILRGEGFDGNEESNEEKLEEDGKEVCRKEIDSQVRLFRKKAREDGDARDEAWQVEERP